MLYTTLIFLVPTPFSKLSLLGEEKIRDSWEEKDVMEKGGGMVLEREITLPKWQSREQSGGQKEEERRTRTGTETKSGKTDSDKWRKSAKQATAKCER